MTTGVGGGGGHLRSVCRTQSDFAVPDVFDSEVFPSLSVRRLPM